jgi:hypothetical protein
MNTRSARTWWVALVPALVLGVAVALILGGARGGGSTSASTSADGADSRSAYAVTVVLRTGEPSDAMLNVIFKYSRFSGVISAAGGQTIGRFNLGADATVADLAKLESALHGDPGVVTVREDPPGSAPPLDPLTKTGSTS